MSDHLTEQTTEKIIGNSNYWGFWVTLALSILIFIIFSVLQSLILTGYMFINEGVSIADALQSDSTVDLEKLLSNYALNGDAISISQIPSALIGIALVILFVFLRRTIGIKDYLELYLRQS